MRLECPCINDAELGSIIASGRATAEQWAKYWSAYAQDVERQRREKEPEEKERAEKQTRPKPLENSAVPAQSPRRNHTGVAGAAGIGLGSAIAIVLSFQLNHSILWAIIHGILSWFYVAYRAWQGNY